MTNSTALLQNCTICPRNCAVNRFEKTGFCKSGSELKISIYQLHFGEEPVISGTNGSGTIFFSNCNLQCVFCQNAKISCYSAGRNYSTNDLAEIMLELQDLKAHNINLVTPTHFTPQIRDAIIQAKNNDLKIPIVWNSNAYEKVETLQEMNNLVDIYLPDFKYWLPEISKKYSKADDYTFYTKKALLEMHNQVGNLVIENNLAVRGMIIRLLVLPGNLNSIEKILKWICGNIGTEVYISLMGQYYPTHKSTEFPEINRQITTKEYEFAIEMLEKFGFENGFLQEVGSSSDFTPEFL